MMRLVFIITKILTRLGLYWFSSALSIITLSLTLLIGWLFFTSLGGQWLLQQVPGLTVKGFQGQLASQWQVKQVQWQSDNLKLELENLVFSWQLSCLLEQRVCLKRLDASLIRVTTPQETAAPASLPPLDWSSLRLPSIQLPQLDLLELAYLKSIEINQLRLGSLVLNDQQQLSHLNVRAKWQATRISLEKFELQSPWLPAGLEGDKTQPPKIQLKGWLLAEKNWPLKLNLNSELSDFPLQLALTGDFKQLAISTHLMSLAENNTALISLNGWVNLLNSAAPVDLNLAWQNLDPPKIYTQLAGWPKGLQLEKGKLLLQGDLKKGWQLTIDSAQKLDQQRVTLNLHSNLSWERLWLESLHLGLGEASWLALELDLAKTAKQQFKLAGKLTGQLAPELTTPTELDSEFSGFLDVPSLTSKTPSYQLTLDKLDLMAGQDKLALALTINPQRWQSSLAIDVADFDNLIQSALATVNQSFPELININQVKALVAEHQLEGDLKLNSSLNLPALPLNKQLNSEQLFHLITQGEYRLNLATSQLGYTNSQLQNTQVDFAFIGQEDHQNSQLDLKLASQQLMMLQDKKSNDQEAILLEAIKVDLAGTLTAHQLTSSLIFDKQPLELGVQGGVQLKSLDHLQWHYQLASLSTTLAKPWLPEDLRWTDQLEGELSGQWQNQQLKAGIELTSGPGELAVKLEDTLNKTFTWVAFNYQVLNLGLTLKNNQLTAQVIVDGEELGYLNTKIALNLQPDVTTQQRAIKGDYQLTGLELQAFLPFLGIDQLAGQVAGQGEIRGHLLAPEVWGDLQLKKVVLADTRWPVTLGRLDGQLLLQGEKLRLNADFATGEGGEGRLAGEVNWQAELTARLHLEGEAFQVRVEPWASLQVTPDLTFSYKQQALLLAGKIKIPSGLISVQQLPKQAVKVSDDARVVGREIITAQGPKLNLDLELLLGNGKEPNKPPLSLDAFGLNAELQGRLRVGNELQTHGELLLVKGVYQSWGQDLKLRKARLNFAGPVSLPFLDIEAVREVEEITVGIKMTGRVDRPEAEIFSEPSMANEQALSWLILGRPLRTEKDENSLNAAAISFGLKQASGVTQRVGESLGLKDFQLIAEGGGSETSVVASGYINDRLSVRYGVGVYDEITRFVVRYDLTRQVYIEAASSLASSLDIFWRLEF